MIKKCRSLSSPNSAAPLARIAADVAALAPAAPRRASRADVLRCSDLAKLLDEGTEPLAAFWLVASHPRTGYACWRGSTRRPDDHTLRMRLASLLARAAPLVVEEARASALNRLASLGAESVGTVRDVMRGKAGRADRARTRLDAARTVLDAVGVGGRSGGVTVATQINVGASIADKIREAQAVRSEP